MFDMPDKCRTDKGQLHGYRTISERELFRYRNPGYRRCSLVEKMLEIHIVHFIGSPFPVVADRDNQEAEICKRQRGHFSAGPGKDRIQAENRIPAWFAIFQVVGSIYSRKKDHRENNVHTGHDLRVDHDKQRPGKRQCIHRRVSPGPALAAQPETWEKLHAGRGSGQPSGALYI